MIPGIPKKPEQNTQPLGYEYVDERKWAIDAMDALIGIWYEMKKAKEHLDEIRKATVE